MKLLHDLSLDELKRELEQLIEKMPRFRAQQIFDWATLYASFDEMTNLSKALRQKLDDNFVIFSCTIEKKLIL